MLNKIQHTILLLLLSLLSCNSLAQLVPKFGWVYTGGGGRTTPGGTILGLNLTDPNIGSPFHYTQAEMNTVANDYSTHVPALHFGISSLSAIRGVMPDPVTGDATHIITPDPVTGYDGNVAVITGDFSPAVWDGAAITYNEYGQSCLDVINLSLVGTDRTKQYVKLNKKCVESRDPPDILNPTNSPYIAFAAIYINTHGDSQMLPVHSKHLHLLTHELGHVLGLAHDGNPNDFYAHCTNSHHFNPTRSVMVYDSNPDTCRGAPTSLQPIDITTLNTMY